MMCEGCLAHIEFREAVEHLIETVERAKLEDAMDMKARGVSILVPKTPEKLVFRDGTEVELNGRIMRVDTIDEQGMCYVTVMMSVKDLSKLWFEEGGGEHSQAD